MIGILNYARFPEIAETKTSDNSLRVSDSQDVILVADIPEGYFCIEELTILGDVRVVKIAKVTGEEEKTYTRRMPSSRMSTRFSGIDLTKYPVLGKIPIFGTEQDIDYPDRMVVCYSCVPVRTSGNSVSDTLNGMHFGFYETIPLADYGLYGVNGGLIAQATEQMLWLHGDYNQEQIKFILKNFDKLSKRQSETDSDNSVEKYFTEIMNRKKDEFEKFIESTVRDNEQMAENIVQNVRKIQRTQGSIQGIIESISNMMGSMQKELKKIEAYDKVREIKFISNRIFLKTNVLINKVKVNSSNVRNVIFGEYVVVIDIERGTTYVKNMLVITNDRHHPHDIGGGKLCLGTLDGTLPKLLGQFELFAAVTEIVDFLSTANYRDHAGSSVIAWPYIEKREIITPAGAIWLKPKESIHEA